MSENRKLRRLRQKLRREERNAIQDPGPATPAGVSPFQAVQMQIRMGPLPTAEELAHYDAVLPGTAERLVRQMERMTDLAAEQQKHRFGLEKDVINGNIQSQKEGTGLVASSHSRRFSAASRSFGTTSPPAAT